MIDIIIPMYNSHLTISRTLQSIASQKVDIKLNVYIVDDASTYNYKNEINLFKDNLQINELRLEENSGPGVARQYGIDNSNGEYIIFIDSDDVFYDEYSVQNLINAIKGTDFDVVISDFVEETDNDLIDHIEDNIWLHGKIYKRKFLEDKNIRFNNTRANEDNGFNQLILLCDANIGYISLKTYIWLNNSNSITRKNNHSYEYLGIKEYIYNINWAIENALIRNGNCEKISKIAFSTLVATYYYYLIFSDYKESYKFIEYIKPIKIYCDKYNLSDEEKMDIMEQQFNYFINRQNRKKILIPNIIFTQFLDMIGNS